MSFLAPAVLWGLVAASIPLIIHLISTRRTQKVDFSSIRFIKVLEHDTIRKLKLRQWLLLLLRTVAIILIVLVFARPVKVGYFPAWAAGQQTAKLVFLLDNSASMSARFSGESLLERSKNRVLEILEGVEGKLSIDIYQTTPLSKRYSGKLLPPHELERLLGLVRETQGPDSLWEAVRRVLDQAAVEGGQGEVANREFFLFSDFPATVPEGWTP
ncbi:MAG: BatA and WFA domain-containing protein, partial [Fidelibacterota bacterium]